MLSILVNAYACSPNMGSEPGMAWNWCVNLASYCELHIITEGEFRDKIEAVLPTLPQGRNMHFYYNPVSEEVRRMCWNQGDWRFYKHYREWQWRTYEIAKEIMRCTHIDILHQLNMIGFREPGYLWKIENVPFVWGPIGGLMQFPTAYLRGAGLWQAVFNRIKNVINVWQIKHDKRVASALHRASVLVSSIPDSANAIKRWHHLDSIVIPETGCEIIEEAGNKGFSREGLDVIWVGKFDFRKRLDIALKALKATKNKSIHLNVFGTGTEKQIEEARKMSTQMGLDNQVSWMGAVTNEQVKKSMNESDVFLFTSISEETSTVVLEAISQCLPVVCFDTCGMAYVINESVGRKITLTNPSQSAEDFAKVLSELANDKTRLEEMSSNCALRAKELSWESKARQMVELYKKAIGMKS